MGSLMTWFIYFHILTLYATYFLYQSNTGQTGGKRNIDLNVASAWEQGFTGKGVVVTILDDGIDHGHPDIKRNYVSSFST